MNAGWDEGGNWRRHYAEALAAARRGELTFPDLTPDQNDSPLESWLDEQLLALPALSRDQHNLLGALPLRHPLALAAAPAPQPERTRLRPRSAPRPRLLASDVGHRPGGWVQRLNSWMTTAGPGRPLSRSPVVLGDLGVLDCVGPPARPGPRAGEGQNSTTAPGSVVTSQGPAVHIGGARSAQRRWARPVSSWRGSKSN